MTARSTIEAPVLVAGGGIGGMACALALAREGQPVELFEQSATIGEIGAGLQLGPNAFAALEALGVGEQVRRAAVFTERMVMMDAVDCSEVASIPVGTAFRERFGNPYAVSHRADLHAALHAAAAEHPLVRVHVGARIAAIDRIDGPVAVRTADGRRFEGSALVGCDGVKSVVRDRLVGDAPRVSGHVVYRAVVPVADMPADMRWNAPVVWAGPDCHLVHYPLRGGEQYNLVVTFHSRDEEQWGVTDGSQDEVLSYFRHIDARPRRLLDLPRSWRRWSTADRDPVTRWSEGCATLLGDAAHPMMQYLAQGACMALEDAVTLGRAASACRAEGGGVVDWPAAFRRYESARVARTARVVLSVREFGRLCHSSGVERLVRNTLWAGRSAERFYDALEWLYGWRPERCLAH
ncbi:3-hydroxybenzoate 6-monooxygenase [Variovorax sp. JS1663]|uniref:3-hydroxybenzoate 6-monooxygenase n=1 Tax=Variovorax sp. JS1663 TaxID=1851577 RepID=UPI000B341896|nr:3-hydroxybenzoate 6-monooxygenase [Variovorax sp. JS1663]OUL97977.1 salicylate hydroxylase [Variovorax sp. JS1663]